MNPIDSIAFVVSSTIAAVAYVVLVVFLVMDRRERRKRIEDEDLAQIVRARAHEKRIAPLSGRDATMCRRARKTVLMEVDAAILDELVRAGLGEDRLSVVSNSLKFSKLLIRFADKNGCVHVQEHDANGEPTRVIAVHAFEV
ncbi:MULTISPECIES: hypothetical protein [Burkholderia]|uniref:hypothetical protein n=1 Tax=Burkholderia TaxID=32008 RepID=UPI0016400D51|nr:MULTISPECIES: hypothetical protein [Burkholderia]